MTHGSIIDSDFRPPWLLRNPHLQTLWPKLLMQLRQQGRASAPPQTALERRRIELADGDSLTLPGSGVLDTLRPAWASATSPNF